MQTPFSREVELGSLKTSDINPNLPQVTVQAVLCWSEYYNGKWQPPKTSDVNNPVSLDTSSPSVFDRSTLRLWSDEPQDGQLRITIYGNVTRRAFLLYNTHSLPLPCPPAEVPPLFGKTRGFEIAGLTITATIGGPATFRIDYDEKTPDIPDHPFFRDVLTSNIIDMAPVIQPNHDTSDIWDAPFFYADARHVFSVTSQEQPIWVIDSEGYGVSVNPGAIKAAHIPQLVVQPGPPIPPKNWVNRVPIGPNLGVNDPAPMQRFVTEDTYIRQGIGTTAVVRYGDRQIGPSGTITNVQAEK